MAVLTSTPIKSSTGRLAYLFDKPSHRNGVDRVLAAGGQNINLIHDPETGAISAHQSGDYLQRQFHAVLNRAKNPKRRTQSNSIIISFADSELTGSLQERAQQALQLADGFMQSTQPASSQYTLCVQADGKNGHVHVHCLANAIKTDGKTVQTNNFSVGSLRKKMDAYMSAESEKVTGKPWVNPIQPKVAKATSARDSLPVKAPWQQVIKDAVDDVKLHAVSVDAFKDELKDSYGITITERGKNKTWTYKIDDASGKEKKVRGFYQLIDKTTGVVKSTRGLGSDYGREAVTQAIADLHRTDATTATPVPTPAPLSEADALMAKLATKTANVTTPPVVNDIAAVEARMAANVAKTESRKEWSKMFDDDEDDKEFLKQMKAEEVIARNHYADLMKPDLAGHHEPTPAPKQAPVIAVAKQIQDTKQVIADTKAADAQAKDDDEQSARGLALSRNRHALATRLVTGFAEANASIQNDSEENNNFGFLQKPVADWTEQDHDSFNQACHDAEASESAPAAPDPADVQARTVKAKVALLERDFGSSYADLFKDRGAHAPAVIKQARQAMEDYEHDGEMTVSRDAVDKTGAVTGGGSTSYSKLAVLARALKQVFMARLLYKQKITLRTIVRTTMQENRVTKQAVQHKADVQQAKQDRIASDLEKWHVTPVGSQTAESLHSSITRDRAFAAATVKTRGVTDPRQKQQIYDDTMGVKYTANRNTWQVLHDRAMKQLDKSVANGLPGASQDTGLDR
ncbi:relaxase/mobilization nuclease domain-containing protein [Lactiplantibacillus plantarum]|uniref:relaxase/mobilization nuclease domain-containing protein n=1 Tax=Lactiplantibacillus plantarum TaxID=1590 RepID=UPI004035609A